jgi:membrane protease YdiL (CAAX protease family)
MTAEPATPPPALPYHRLFRAIPAYRWWLPLVALALLAAFVVVGTFVVLTIGMFVGLASGEFAIETLQTDLLALDAASPLLLALSLGSIAVWLPAVPLALRISGLRPLGVVHSVQFRLRGRWLAACLVPAAIVMAVTLATTAFVFPALGLGAPLAPPTTDPAEFAICAAIIVLIVPFQAAAEEYVFRGVLTQAVGAWLRWTPLAIVLPTVLFAFGHLYDAWGLLDVAAFGIGAAIVTWRTGGLEAAIVLHALNNVAVFLLLASGMLGTTVVEREASNPVSLGLTVVTTAGYVLWVDRLATRRGLIRVAVPHPSPVEVHPIRPGASPKAPELRTDQADRRS